MRAIKNVCKQKQYLLVWELEKRNIPIINYFTTVVVIVNIKSQLTIILSKINGDDVFPFVNFNLDLFYHLFLWCELIFYYD